MSQSGDSTIRSNKTWKDHLMKDDNDSTNGSLHNNSAYDPGSSTSVNPDNSHASNHSNAEEDKLKRYSDQIEEIEANINRLDKGVKRLTKRDKHDGLSSNTDSEPESAVTDSDVEIEISLEDEKKNQETLFFLRSRDQRRIDYVLSYVVDPKSKQYEDHANTRRIFEKNLKRAKLKLEREPPEKSADGKTGFLKVHATWDALITQAELMNMKKRLRKEKNLNDEEAFCNINCGCTCLEIGEPIVTTEEDYFTATFTADTMKLFDIGPTNKDKFFTNSERSLIVKEILDRTQYSRGTKSKYGIHKLLNRGIYTAAFPLHEGPFLSENDDDPFNGIDKDRQRLYDSWARPGRWYCYQPLDLIRKYFGEKIGIYFAWLGFYTMMLIPASVVGLVAFIYGIATVWDDRPSKDICDADWTMCPQCDLRCEYWDLKESCIYSRITYIFDNAATVAFAGFMAIWAMFFLEFWKRKQKELEYDWDVANFELEERVRPEFDNNINLKTRINPITELREPFVPMYQAIPRTMTSFLTIIFFIILVLAAIFGVIVYRIIIVSLMYYSNDTTIHSYAKIVTSLTAAIINFIVIIVLNTIYNKVAHFLTEFEFPRTDTEFEDSFTFKMFLFQFVNFYGTIFYIAFFKGSFASVPGDKSSYFLGKWRPDECDPSGCIVDLFLQLAIIMTGKQVLNNLKEIMLPKLLTWYRSRSSKKQEKEENVYMRWEQDKDLQPLSPLGLFDEYLEMVIQYGFVTLFVAAFPLAPLLALLNNIIEIRLDAYKFVCVMQRPPATKAQDIGVWFDILEVISFVGVLSNAFIIGWTSEFIPKLVWRFEYTQNSSLVGYIDGSLSTFAISDFNGTEDVGPSDEIQEKFPNVTHCRFRGFYTDYASDEPYTYTLMFWHVLAARLAFIIIFEHTIFVLTSLVKFIIPDVPSAVKQLMLYESALVKKARFDAAQEHIEEEETLKKRNSTLKKNHNY